MTMRIKITNEDDTRISRVEVQDWSPGRPYPDRAWKERLFPGQSREYHIHAARTLRITEDPNAPTPREAGEEG